MPEKMLPLDEFMQLETEEQVEKLKRWKMDYTLKDIREAWNFKHSAQYYMLLKKLRIYERVVNKSDKFYPAQEQLLNQQSLPPEARGWRSPAELEVQQPSDRFNFELNTTLKGPELAEKLERLALFVKGEMKDVAIKLTISAVDAKESDKQD